MNIIGLITSSADFIAHHFADWWKYLTGAIGGAGLASYLTVWESYKRIKNERLKKQFCFEKVTFTKPQNVENLRLITEDGFIYIEVAFANPNYSEFMLHSVRLISPSNLELGMGKIKIVNYELEINRGYQKGFGTLHTLTEVTWGKGLFTILPWASSPIIIAMQPPPPELQKIILQFEIRQNKLGKKAKLLRRRVTCYFESIDLKVHHRQKKT